MVKHGQEEHGHQEQRRLFGSQEVPDETREDESLSDSSLFVQLLRQRKFYLLKVFSGTKSQKLRSESGWSYRTSENLREPQRTLENMTCVSEAPANRKFHIFEEEEEKNF